jgi:DNA invertase Pin-like site-specific DNA recombinase
VKTIGYLRVSTDKQDHNNQKAAILEYANGHGFSGVQFISETISSRKENREIYQVVESLKTGDVLIIYELSRLARSMNELQSLMAKIRDKKATLLVVDRDMTVKPDSSDLLTHTLIFILSVGAQMERDMISSRTKNALAVRKAKGLPMGRPAGKSRLDDKSEAIAKYQDIGLNRTAIAKLIGCNRQTLTNWLNARKQ